MSTGNWHSYTQVLIQILLYIQVDAMKLGVKEMRKEYKKVNIDEIEVSTVNILCMSVLDCK